MRRTLRKGAGGFATGFVVRGVVRGRRICEWWSGEDPMVSEAQDTKRQAAREDFFFLLLNFSILFLIGPHKCWQMAKHKDKFETFEKSPGGIRVFLFVFDLA